MNQAGLGTAYSLALGFLIMPAAIAAQRQDVPPQTITPKVERMIDVGGRKLHARIYGQGSPAVVLLSGSRASQTYWDPVVPALVERTTVVTYDRAGYGKSEMGAWAVTASSR